MTAPTNGRQILLVDNRSEYFLGNRGALASRLSQAGMSVHVATFATRTGDDERIRSLGVEFIDLGGALRGAKQLTNVLRSLRPCLVHVFTLKAALLSLLALAVNRKPTFVLSVTGLGYAFTSEGTKAAAARTITRFLLAKAILPRARLVVFQNPDDREFFVSELGLPTQRSALIPGSGVDLDLFKHTSEPSEPPEVLFLGRLLRDKGILEFAEAAKIVRAAREDIRFSVVGDLDPSNPASIDEELPKRWTREQILNWEGYHNDIPSRIPKATLVCLPSYREGLPKAVIEASACGRPTIGTDVPGVREAILSGKTGVLVPPKDPSALAEAILSLIGSPETLRSMGENAREFAEREFGVATITSALLDMYGSLGVPLR